MQRSILVIGLGTFGDRTARALYNAGANVLAVDLEEEIIDHIRDGVSKAVCADALDEDALRAVGAFDVDSAVVAIRRRFDTTVLVTHMLRRNNIPEILVQVDSDLEASAVRVLGATRVIFPERDTAERTARDLMNPNLADQIPLGADYAIIEVPLAPKLAGRSVIELDVRKRYGLNVIGIRKPAKGTSTKVLEISFSPDAPLEATWSLLVLGKSASLQKFRDWVESGD